MYDKFGLRFPNFNFNVSHHGDYVAIASEPVCLVGLDIVSYDIPRGETITEFIHFFSSYFSSLEWDNIVNAGTSDDVLIEFYRYACILFVHFCQGNNLIKNSACGSDFIAAAVPDFQYAERVSSFFFFFSLFFFWF